MRLKLTKKQNEYIRNADARWNLKIGAVRSGKSFVDVAYIIPFRIRQRADKPGLTVIMGVSKGTIERNVLQPMREIYTGELVGSINNENIAQVFGEPVYCLGAEKMSQVAKILGSSIKYCYGDEIAKWNKEVFNVLKSRLDKEYSCFDGSCNPESPNHWLKEFIEDDNLDAYIQKYQIFDNPNLPKSYVENLCNEYAGTVYYDRYILGEWALAEGLIYPMYKDALVDSLPMQNGAEVPADDICVSIDYGTMNAFAAMLWTKRDGIWYAEREYYYSGRDTGVQKTDQEYSDALDEWIKDVWDDKKANPQQSYLGGLQATRIETIIDPSAASFIALLKKNDWAKVRAANNDVLDGIRESAVALQTGKIKILRSLKNWQKEAGGYVWDDKSVEERPVKVNDHLMDGMRYFVKTKRIAAKHRPYPI